MTVQRVCSDVSRGEFLPGTVPLRADWGCQRRVTP